MSPELNKLVTKIEMLENEKLQLIQTNASEIDVLAVEDEIEQTTLQYNTLLQLQEYQKFCNHVFIEDLIDITPDKSKTIEYCAHCFVGKTTGLR